MNPVGATPAHKPNYVRPSDMHVLSSQCHLGGSPCIPVIALADHEQVCRERDALTEANKNLALLLESARHYVVKAGTTGAFELRNRIDAVLAQVRK